MASLRSQLQREQALAAERQADHADAVQQLEGSRQRAAELELQSQASQREALEVRAELQQAQAEREAALMAAAERAEGDARAPGGQKLGRWSMIQYPCLGLPCSDSQSSPVMTQSSPAAAGKEAADAAVQLEARSVQLGEVQAERERLQLVADDLTQRCTQLHDENVHLASMLAQRDNELLGA